MKKLASHKKFIVIFTVFIAILAVFSFSLVKTHLAIKNLLKFQTSQASKNASQAIFLSKTLNFLTLNSISTFKVWQLVLEEILITDKIVADSSVFMSQILDSSNQQNTFSQNISQFNKNAKALLSEIEKSFLIKKFLEPKQLELISQLKNINQDFDQLLNHILNEKISYLVILQNTHEIRATGGFMGSYAKVDLENGQIKNLKIEDIYQPAGQFSGFIQAPTGVEKFLSGGKGLQLPDSNWHPDFPTSAQTILNFFALGNESAINGIIAINLNTIENLLKITGEIYLPDYDQVINHENFAEIARADRENFFPGSRQKQNFLNSTLTQLIIRLKSLDANKKKLIARQLISEIPHKNIQFFSNDPLIQLIFEKYRLSGELLPINPNSNYLYLIESNVGINKANKNILRQVSIDFSEKKTYLSINFTNNNIYIKSNKPKNQFLAEADNLNYTNYQRLIIPVDHKIENIMVNEQKIQEWDEEIIQNSKGQSYKQIGFILTVPEQSTAEVRIELSHPEPFSLNPTLIIQKQSGLPATPYTISYKNKKIEILLEKDEVMTF